MQTIRRLHLVKQQLIPIPQTRTFARSATMALDINTKIRMKCGYEIPQLGYGVYQTPADDCHKVTDHAIKSGYRHVDSVSEHRGGCRAVFQRQ